MSEQDQAAGIPGGVELDIDVLRSHIADLNMIIIAERSKKLQAERGISLLGRRLSEMEQELASLRAKRK